MSELVTFLYSQCQHAIYKNRVVDHFECKNRELDNDFYFCFKYYALNPDANLLQLFKSGWFVWFVKKPKTEIYNFFFSEITIINNMDKILTDYKMGADSQADF